ncbi:MAG TPA: hypothetical protein VEW92_11725 [Nitrososphaeraceae archaeon]|nr:hypothetical protein [Nitrososphaeraceae archaeon]
MKIRFERNRTSTVIVMYFLFAEKFIRSLFVSSVEFCKLKLPNQESQEPSGPQGQKAIQKHKDLLDQ